MGIFSSLFGEKTTTVGVPAEAVCLPSLVPMLGFVGAAQNGTIRGTLMLSITPKDSNGDRNAKLSINLAEIDGCPAKIYFDSITMQLSRIDGKWERIAKKNELLDNLFCGHGEFFFDFETAPTEPNGSVNFEKSDMVIRGYRNETPKATYDKLVEELRKNYPTVQLNTNSDYTFFSLSF